MIRKDAAMVALSYQAVLFEDSELGPRCTHLSYLTAGLRAGVAVIHLGQSAKPRGRITGKYAHDYLIWQKPCPCTLVPRKDRAGIHRMYCERELAFGRAHAEDRLINSEDYLRWGSTDVDGAAWYMVGPNEQAQAILRWTEEIWRPRTA